MQHPPMENLNSIWVKEITMKTKSTASNNRLSVASNQIKECLKALKN